MTRPSGRKLLLFAILSVVYASFAALVVALMAVRSCSTQPDVAAMCDATPVGLTFFGLAAIYLAGTFLYFRRKISGVD